jgi:hypothetical protein
MADDALTASSNPTPQPAAAPSGIEGWLLIPYFGMLVGAVQHAHAIIDGPIAHVSTEIFVANGVMAVGSVAVFTMMSKKHSIVPLLVLVYAVTDVAIHGLEFVAVSTPWLQIEAAIAEAARPRVTESLSSTVVFWAVFVPYFLSSQRVKNTFVHD